VPNGLAYEDALALRAKDSGDYKLGAWRRCPACPGELDFQAKGAKTFDLRQQHPRPGQDGGVADAFDIPDSFPNTSAAVLPGQGPVSLAALSGKPADIYATDEAVLQAFPEDAALAAGSAKLVKR
jgi:urocanate hydratase